MGYRIPPAFKRKRKRGPQRNHAHFSRALWSPPGRPKGERLTPIGQTPLTLPRIIIAAIVTAILAAIVISVIRIPVNTAVRAVMSAEFTLRDTDLANLFHAIPLFHTIHLPSCSTISTAISERYTLRGVLCARNHFTVQPGKTSGKYSSCTELGKAHMILWTYPLSAPVRVGHCWAWV